MVVTEDAGYLPAGGGPAPDVGEPGGVAGAIGFAGFENKEAVDAGLNGAVVGEGKDFAGDELAAGGLFPACILRIATGPNAHEELGGIGGDEAALVVEKFEIRREKGFQFLEIAMSEDRVEELMIQRGDFGGEIREIEGERRRRGDGVGAARRLGGVFIDCDGEDDNPEDQQRGDDAQHKVNTPEGGEKLPKSERLE